MLLEGVDTRVDGPEARGANVCLQERNGLANHL